MTRRGDGGGVAALAGTVWDVAVVGAGPAGAVAAHGMSAAGAKVLLIDRALFPRSKVCGCCLSSRAVAALACCGITLDHLSPPPHTYDRLQVAAGRSRTSLPLPPGLSISRDVLDAALVTTAVSAGAHFISGAAASLVSSGHNGLRVVRLDEVAGDSATVTCRVVIAAVGLGPGFATRELGGERMFAGARIGAQAVLDATDATPWCAHAINMAIGADGYVGAVRLTDGRWNLAAAVDVAASKRRHGMGHVVAAILESVGWPMPATGDGPCWHGTPRLWRRPRRVAAQRLFAIGDAAGYVEPFTGEGMACAIEDARAVVPLGLQAMDRWDDRLAHAWTARLESTGRRRTMLPAMLAMSVRQPRLASGITSLLSRWPSLAGPLISRAAAPASGKARGYGWL